MVQVHNLLTNIQQIPHGDVPHLMPHEFYPGVYNKHYTCTEIKVKSILLQRIRTIITLTFTKDSEMKNLKTFNHLTKLCINISSDLI